MWNLLQDFLYLTICRPAITLSRYLRFASWMFHKYIRTSWILGEGSVPCIGRLSLVFATRYLVILARSYEDRITTSSRITRSCCSFPEADWSNKMARCADGFLNVYQHGPHYLRSRLGSYLLVLLSLTERGNHKRKQSIIIKFFTSDSS